MRNWVSLSGILHEEQTLSSIKESEITLKSYRGIGKVDRVRILVISDFHGSVEAAQRSATKAQNVKADVIVVCGDITHFGSVDDAQKILTPLVNLRLPLFYVPGNCDPAQLAEAKIKDAVNLHGQCQKLGNASFIGLGGAPASPFYSWFELSELQMMNTLEQAAEGCGTNRWFVLVSHAPPKDTSVDVAFSSVHAGSTSLRSFIEARKPSLVFCGHIHEARGIDRIGDTILVNPGSARHGNYAMAILDDKIEVRLDLI